ncbi:MAG: AAA family ATPase [Candidatus Omnitrophica bacterium]|nr:AAA family ATPase [Candidatus Omnitrophota bacterium]
MGYVIAMAGKGGTGKTTIAALIVRLIRDLKLGTVLAIDADPSSNLAETLGIDSKATIGSILDDICAHPEKVPPSMGKDAFIEYQVQTAIAEGEGFDCLTMGRPEGPGCYCYVNNALRNSLGKLIKDYDYVVIDNEAGLEHLSRRTTRSADALVVVSNATQVGLIAAKRIRELIAELKIKTKKELLIINCADKDIEKDRIKDMKLDYLGFIPQDPTVEIASLNGSCLLKLTPESISLLALRKIGEPIWRKT